MRFVRSTILALWLGLAVLPVAHCGEKPQLVPDTPAPEIKFPLPSPTSIGAEKFAALLNAFVMQGSYENWQHDARPRATGSFTVHPSGEIESRGTHGSSAVKVYYSPEVYKWMEGGSKGLIPDGGVILKVLYARNPQDPAKFSDTPTGFSIMVKDSKASWDGWFYSDGGPLTKPTHENAANLFDPNAGFALSCINCHATADNPEGTYSSLRNVKGEPPYKYPLSISPEGLIKQLKPVEDIHEQHEFEKGQTSHPVRAELWALPNAAGAVQEPAPLTFATYDHVPQGPRPNGQREFITSSNCMACHDASQLYSITPNMAVGRERKSGGKDWLNLSPYSEWRYSPMGLAGRDPIFFAQLESERALHPELADKIDDNCLSCHAPMGQRQWKADKGADALFTSKIAMSEPGGANEHYGALARDGVSCVVCHRMSPDGLGEPQTYSGNFKLQDGPAQVFGPYEKVATLPMEQAIGITPKHGVHISNSKLCASCHTVVLPVLDAGKKYNAKDYDDRVRDQLLKHGFHEQATYLEWKNSRYSTEAAAPNGSQRSCQACHMPKQFDDKPLRFKIANIEDDTFPQVDHRAPDDKIRMEIRDSYARHALHGANIFLTEMFNQQPQVLGVPRKDNMYPGKDVRSGLDLAAQSALKFAREQTAEVKILSVRRDGKQLTAQVKVTNLTGHKFPTGVNFRRAFLEFKVMADNRPIWISGATDARGVIGTLDAGKFTPLKTEFLKERQFQPHHRKIMREDEVQIYESLIADSNGELTTSFLNLSRVVKDNRLLPRGWSSTGPDADLTRAIGTGEDPDYANDGGQNVVEFDVPLNETETKNLSISATLYYQTIPPYYLQQRFEAANGPDTQRLRYLVNSMDPANPLIGAWKLMIAEDKKLVE